MKTIGIVVPVRRMAGQLQNLETWLTTCLSFPQISVYLVHDWGDEQTWEELHELVIKLGNKNIILSQCRAGNPGGARNFGLQQSNDDYLIFWDSDDVGYVNRIVDVLETTPGKDVIICNFEMEFPGLPDRIVNKHYGEFRQVYKNPGLWRFLFKREYLENILFDELNMGEDQLFLERLAILNSEYHFSETIIYSYVVNRVGSLTASKNVTDLKMVVAEGFGILLNQPQESFTFVKSLLTRQCLTLIRYGNIDEKIFGIKNLFQISFIKFHKI